MLTRREPGRALVTTLADMHRIFTTSVASVYPHYVDEGRAEGAHPG